MLVVLALVIGVIVPCGVAIWAAGEIASPPRSPLKTYHREFLDEPAVNGLSIRRFTASDGTPCLVCLPEPGGRLGKRGPLLRAQLADRGFTLPPPGKPLGTLVLCHGRKGRKEDFLPIAERFCAVGFRCVIPDFPAHGDHPGKLATYGVRESSIPARVLHEAAAKFGFPTAPAGIFGMSMGGSLAVHAAAAQDTPFTALAVVSTFDSVRKAIDGHSVAYAGAVAGPICAGTSSLIYRWRTGISFDEIRPDKHAARILIPTLAIHGSDDHSVPTASGKCLFDALPAATPKKWVSVPGANHDNVLVTDFPVYAEIAAWMLRHVAGMSPAGGAGG